MHEHIESFIVARSYAETSARQRRWILHHFADTIDGDLGVPSVHRWWASIAHLAPATRRAHLSAVRQYIGYLNTIGVLSGDPTSALTAPRIQQAPPVTLSHAEAVRLLATVTDPQTRVCVALMLGCGLRGGDVARLDVGDVNTHDRVLRVHGKGGKVRLVPIPHLVADLLTRHIAGRFDGPLIRDASGVRLTPERLRAHVTRELERAGIKRGAWDGRSSHVLRRTCATTLLEGGAASLNDVKAILGHRSLSSTERYLAVPDVHRLRGVIETGPLGDAA